MCFFWLFFLGFIIFLPLRANADNKQVINGESAVLMDAYNGQVLYQKNMNQKMYPASTTKILTAILALEMGKLNDVVKVSYEASSTSGSAIGLQKGERIKLEDLLYALMLTSANDAALAIAEHLGGSESGFTRLMNEKAKFIGAKNSNFKNPNGLPDKNHYTTAYDLALIARYAMENPTFRKIVAARVKVIQREIPKSQVYLYNHNKLLWSYPGAIGIKTGYTVDAGQCLVAFAQRENRKLIAVVLKSQGANLWTDVKSLLDYGFLAFRQVELVSRGEVIKRERIKYGGEVNLLASSSFFYDFPLNYQEKISYQFVLNPGVRAPVEKGQQIGEMILFDRDCELGRVSLVAQKLVKRKLIAKWWFWALIITGFLLYFKRRSSSNRWRY